jgi:hypothetical protein
MPVGKHVLGFCMLRRRKANQTPGGFAFAATKCRLFPLFPIKADPQPALNTLFPMWSSFVWHITRKRFDQSHRLLILRSFLNLHPLIIRHEKPFKTNHLSITNSTVHRAMPKSQAAAIRATEKANAWF